MGVSSFMMIVPLSTRYESSLNGLMRRKIEHLWENFEQQTALSIAIIKTPIEGIYNFFFGKNDVHLFRTIPNTVLLVQSDSTTHKDTFFVCLHTIFNSEYKHRHSEHAGQYQKCIKNKCKVPWVFSDLSVQHWDMCFPFHSSSPFTLCLSGELNFDTWGWG